MDVKIHGLGSSSYIENLPVFYGLSVVVKLWKTIQQ